MHTLELSNLELSADSVNKELELVTTILSKLS